MGEQERPPLLTGPELYGWTSKQIEKFRKRRKRIAGLYIIAALVSFFSPIVIALPVEDRPTFVTIEVAILGLTLFGAGRLAETSEKLLPPVEDRVLYRLQPALTSLKAYIRDWSDSERKSALKNLKRVAYNLDKWNAGNLRFLRSDIGRELSDLKKNFRGRVLFAIKRADKESLPELASWLTNFQNALETGTLNDVTLRTWNQFLSQASPTNPAAPRFQLKEPKPSILRRLTSQWFQVTVVFLVFIAPLVTGLIGVYIVHASVDTAFMSAATVFAGMIVLLVAVIRLKAV